jgi:Anti-sigma-K factor rskA, C-terminal
MAKDHERIEELLAASALGALSGEDAIEADRLLTEHVPTCPLCRETLAGFRGVTDRLVLAAASVTAPDLLLVRLRRSTGEQAGPGRRRGSFVAAAAGVAALVGMAALSMSLGTRATRAETHLDHIAELVDAISQPGAAPVSLRSQLGATPMVEVSGPTIERMIVAGRGIPQPSADSAYVIWVGSDAGFRRLGTLIPDRSGFVYRTFEVDPSTFDRILITEERLGVPPVTPSTDSPHLWEADL